MIYLDSCAIVKLLRVEAESAALRSWLADKGEPLVVSTLARVEVARALRRVEPAALYLVDEVFAVMQHKSINDQILTAAAGYEDLNLRSLDALHLATAEEFRNLLKWFVSYDHRLVSAAKNRGLSVISPSW